MPICLLTAFGMRNSFLIGVGLGGYALTFLAAVVYLSTRRRRSLKERTPLNLKLLRGPGDSLRRQVQAFEDNLLIYTLGVSLAPILAIALVEIALIGFGVSENLQPALYLTLYLVAGVPTLLIAGRWYWLRVRENSERHFAYLGERAVAEELAKLSGQGYRIFHDVPAEMGKRTFNLDHVAVGPSGVYAIETKTRQMAPARPGFKQHEVVYDGTRLIWPWGESQSEIAQVMAQSRWLYTWIQQATGLTIPIRPLLAIPGWVVTEREPSGVRVVSPSHVPEVVLSQTSRILSDDQVDLIAGQLDRRCRDIAI